ncbi:MAG TPA: hypothetical protein VFO95_08495 [Gemmatimonadales bacterium]|nr:hypothetical protein [Gemmatimonadales bacterium]
MRELEAELQTVIVDLETIEAEMHGAIEADNGRELVRLRSTRERLITHLTALRRDLGQARAGEQRRRRTRGREALLEQRPVLDERLRAGTHPFICRMSGSGSTVFGPYRNTGDRDDAAIMLGKRHGRVISTETR